MKSNALLRANTMLFRIFIVVLSVLTVNMAYSQTVDCSINANCTNEFCNYPKESAPGRKDGIEKGCNCFNNYDDDGDGEQDIRDLECAQYYGLSFIGSGEGDCSLDAPSGNPFSNMAPPAVSGQNTADTQSKVSVGDLDGDGIPETIITSKWNSEIRVVATRTHTVDGVSYDPGDIKSDFKTTGQGSKIFNGTGGCKPQNLLFEHENLIANIDKTGTAELFAIVSNRGGNPSTPPTCFFLLALRYAAGDLIPLYDAVPIGPNRPGVFGIADMDGDGKAEIYMRDRIYAAETGKLLATGNGNWDLDITSGPVAVDVVKGDNGKMELVCGTKIYSIPASISGDRNTNSPTVMTPVRDMNTLGADKCFVKLATDPVEYGEDTHSMCSVADVDNDGNIDVIISGALNSVTGKTAVFYWNVVKDKVSYVIVPDPVYANGWPWGTGRVNLIDSDNDKLLDMFFVAGNQMFRVETNGDSFHPDINTNAATYSSFVITRTINDSRSGVLTVTLYDFNNDGEFELVYRDSQELVVVDSETMATKFWSATCQSHTYTEGPVIADVNGDGATDICVPCNRNNSFDIGDPIQQQALGEVRLFFTNANAWLPTRKVWNQPGYFIININDNLTLPFPQFDQTRIFSTGACASNGLSGPQRPLNVFLNQVPFMSASGCPVFPSPDLTFFGDDPTPPVTDTNGDGQIQPSIVVTPPICGNTGIVVQFYIINSGLLPISASVPVSFYNGDPRNGPGGSTYLGTQTLNVSLPVGISKFTDPVTITGPGSEFMMYIVLNNTGFPVIATGKTPTDCDLENNIQQVLVTPTPFALTAGTIKDNTLCAPDDSFGEVAITSIQKGPVVVADWSVYDFQWYNGAGAVGGTERAGATNYNLSGLSAGTYSVIATHKTMLCSSTPADAIVVNNDLSIPFTLVKDSDQTQCTPFNGALSLTFPPGTDLTGVNIVWRDANSNVIIANNVTSITGLKGDATYQVSLERGGCAPPPQFESVLAPVFPTGIALKERDVMNCINLSSGKLSARAYLPGTTTQDPDTSITRYKFAWYNYDNATSTRGSLLPNQPTTGPSAWGLPVGHFEVVITDLITNCSSEDAIVEQVVEGFTLPVAQIDRLKPQTSCDPAQGNAALQATALENGVPADQTKYHFYWYLGQTTVTKLRDNTNTEIDNRILEDVQGGVKGGGQAYTVQIVRKETGCVDDHFLTAEEILRNPVVTLAGLNNDICPNSLGIDFTGKVTASVTFDGATVSDFSNYEMRWYTGSVVDEANRVPASSSLLELSKLQGGYYTLEVEQTTLKCASDPVPVQILDLPSNPVLVPGVAGSTNCTTPPAPDGRAFVASVNGAAVPASGTLPTFTFKWFDGLTATAGSETSGTNNLAFINGRQGSNDPTLSNYTVLVTNDKACSSTLTIHIPDARVIPALSLSPTPNSNCAEGNGVEFTGRVQAVLTNQVGSIDDYSFTWTSTTAGARPVLTGSAGLLWEKVPNGSYSLTVLHTLSGCGSATSSAIVTDISVPPAIVLAPTGSTNCAPAKPGNGSAKIASLEGLPTESAGVPNPAVLNLYEFNWYQGITPSGTSISANYNTTSTLQGAPDAFFIVEVKSKLTNCVNTATVQVPDLSAKPIVTLDEDPNLNCENFNGAAFVTAITYKGAPYTNLANIDYAWYDGSGTGTPRSPQVNDDQLPNLEGGKFYSATVTMIAEGCTSDFVSIEVTDGIVFPDLVTSVTPSKNCPGGTPDGAAEVTSVTPLDTYQYRWYNGNTVGASGSEINSGVADVNIDGKQGGINAFFTVEVKSTTTGCASSEPVLIPDNSTSPIVAPLTAVNNPNCPAFPDGTVNAPEGSVTFNGFTYEGAPVASPYNGFVFVWDGPAAPAEGANLPQLLDRQAGTYTLQVKHVLRNCLSDPVTATVLDEFDFPDIATNFTPQTSCDPAQPNGQVVATVAGTASDFEFEWFSGIGTGGSGVIETTTDGVSTPILPSGDYTILVYNKTTACATTETLVLPDQITIPGLDFTNLNGVTRCDVPNGTATAQLTDLSTPESFTVFYVRTLEGGTYPTDPAVIKTATETYQSTSGIVPPALTNLSSGYITALVRDLNTHCDSDPTTAQISNNTALASPEVVGTSIAGFCNPSGSAPTGGIDINVTGGVAPYTYAWYNGAPVNTDPISFINDANYEYPDFDDDNIISAVQDLAGQPSSTFTVVVIDAVGCGNFLVESVPFQGAPDVDVILTDVTRCIAPFDGKIDVTVTGTGDYEIEIRETFQKTGPLVTSANNPAFSLSASALEKGNYVVVVTDFTADNENCPLTFGQTLRQKAFGPLLSIDQVNPNTSCVPGNSGDGSVSLIAKKQSDDTTTPDYEISSITPSPIGFTAPMPIVASIANPPIPGFGPESYVITVTDQNTGCTSDVPVTIPDQPEVPQDFEVAATPDSFCAPGSNGKLEVTSVSPGAVADYEFTWYDDAGLSTVLNGPDADPVYDISKPNWKVGATTGYGNGNQTYYVRGVKVTGPGEDCPTAVLMRVVEDVHTAPRFATTTRPNTSCVPGQGEGFITITASTDSSDPVIQNAKYDYVFTNVLTSVVTNGDDQDGTVPFAVNNLEHNTGIPYPIIATNIENGCIEEGSVTVQPGQFGLQVTSHLFQDQLICNNDGNITVTQIVLNRSLTGEFNITYEPDPAVPNLNNNFDFRWFRAPDGSPGTFDPAAPLKDDANADIISTRLEVGTGAGQYSDMEAGTYYVVATRKPDAPGPGAGCPAPPYRVNILDRHVNPVLALKPFNNTQCDSDPSFAEGRIQVRVTSDATLVPGPFTYEYTWTTGTVNMPNPGPNNGNGNTDGNLDNDEVFGLVAGQYDISVRNRETGCIVPGSTTVTKTEAPVFLAEADALPQDLCFNSGNVEVKRVEVLDPNDNSISTPPLGDFVYTWFREGTQLTPTGILLEPANYPDIGAGQYSVIATRVLSSDNGPGHGCSSAPFRVDILDRINYPNVTIQPFANSACTGDPDFFEGSARITVNEIGVGAGETYEYTWSAADVTNLSNVLTQAPKPQGPGTGDLQTGLRDDDYTVNVLNLTTGCEVPAQTRIARTTIPVIITKASTTPKEICNPDGTAFIEEILVDNEADLNFNNFDFYWFEGSLATNVINGQQGLAVLDKVAYPNISMNSLTYVVYATRRNDALNADLTEARGRGCSSMPFTVTMPDTSFDPEIAFATAQNTSCNDLAPNGSILATASDPDPSKGPYTYTFNWTPPALPAITTAVDNGAENGFDDAPEGRYFLQLINDVTGCEITRSFDVDLNQTVSLPNIVFVEPTSPIDCNNSGSARVTGVYIGNDTGTEIPGADPRFAYTWYTAYSSPTVNTNIAGQTTDVLPDRAPGKYFVTVIDTFEDRNCPSGPNEVVIEDPIENYPLISISQTLPQISCREDEGTAALLANGSENDGSTDTYTYAWFTGLTADAGSELLDGNGDPVVTNLASNVDDGQYSVRVYNTVTNCSSVEYYIIEDRQQLFFPQIMLSTAGRTNCENPNGVLTAREVGFDFLNTTDPSQPTYYMFAPNYSADFVPGPKEGAGDAFDNDMPQDAGFDQLSNRQWLVTGRDAFEVYTVKITDENTGCFVIEDIEIPNDRSFPAIDIQMENPLINCYEDQPNGQLTATADGGFISGYTFTWFRGDQVIPANQIFVGDKLIGVGQTADNPDLWFTVEVRNNATACVASLPYQLTDSRAQADAPNALTVQDDSRCDLDDGWVTANVNNETFAHNFYWFNDQVTNPSISAAVHSLPDYRDLPTRWYTVVAQEKTTGCLSPPVSTFVADVSIIPNLIFKVTASYCEDVPNELGGGKGNGTIELTLDPATVVSDDIRWTRTATLEDAGLGGFVTGLFPGMYQVDLITTKGCPQTGQVEVPTDIRSYNLVTQNADGKNDKFIIDCISRFPNNVVKIFNRSGVKVYEGAGYDNDGVVFRGIGENGLYMAGTELPVGTYFFIIDKGDGSKPRTGYLELVR